MATLAREPRGESAELIMMFEQQHAMAGLRQHVSAGKPAQSATNDDYVILVRDSFEPVVSHEGEGVNLRPRSAQGVSWRGEFTLGRQFLTQAARSRARLVHPLSWEMLGNPQQLLPLSERS